MRAKPYEYTDHFLERLRERFELSDTLRHVGLIKYQFYHAVSERVESYRYLVFVKGYPAIVVVIDNTMITIYHAVNRAH